MRLLLVVSKQFSIIFLPSLNKMNNHHINCFSHNLLYVNCNWTHTDDTYMYYASIDNFYVGIYLMCGSAELVATIMSGYS